MTVPEKIERLRRRMRAHNVDVYYIPTNDFHGSEYLCDYFKCREYISGFNGSAGTLIVTADEAGLWTDGRYFLQAEAQLEGSGITLYRSGEDGVPSIRKFLYQHLRERQTLGMDGRVVPAAWLEVMKKALTKKGVYVKWDIDLVGEIWDERPDISREPVSLLGEKYSGQSREEKIKKFRAEMKRRKADYFVLTSLEEIGWLLNLRGSDIHCNPVAMAFVIISQERVLLFAHTEGFSEAIKDTFENAGIVLQEYEEIYRYLKAISDDSRVYLDKNVVNAAIVQALPPLVKTVSSPSPIVLWKAVKNPVEVENIKKAHIKDGLAVTRLICWIKTNIGKIEMSECSVAEKLEEFRMEQENYIGPSFDTIAGYAEHGAIVHYTANAETDKKLQPENFLLLDVGGHYLEGTTDVTRTLMLGDADDEQKRHYTAVLRGNLELSAAKFLYGCTGVTVDILARRPLWEMGYSYTHGTGHGVGYLLNVHEGPNFIHYKPKKANESAVFEEGMVTSDEPGLYFAGQYGIRLENLILCVKREKTEYGQFMGFDVLTYVPFDRDAIAAGQMSREEIGILNHYHRLVYETLSPYLEDDEREWLKEACAPISA